MNFLKNKFLNNRNIVEVIIQQNIKREDLIGKTKSWSSLEIKIRKSIESNGKFKILRKVKWFFLV
jgi:hypothetical protein